MKKIFTIIIASLLSFTAMAQDRKVAVFDPAGSVTNSIREIVREEISSVIVNALGYTVLERALINKVLEENKFQSGGLVDDSQISEIGKRVGANLVFVSSLTIMENGNYYVSCKMIDVLSARIEKQKTARTAQGSNDLISVVQKMVEEMFVNTLSGSSANIIQREEPKKEEPKRTVVEEKPVVTRSQPQSEKHLTLYADGMKVSLGGRELSRQEAQNLMANTDALNYYNSGLKNRKIGNILLWSGVGLTAVGILLVSVSEESSYESGYGYSSYEEEESSTLGIIAAGAGVGAGITGFILRSKGKKQVSNAVDIYNDTKNISSIELKLGVAPNGVSLVLNF
jgi:hypothetical protein